MEIEESPVLLRATYALTRSDFYEAYVGHAGWRLVTARAIGVTFLCGAAFIAYAQQYVVALASALFGLILLFQLRLAAFMSFKRDFSPPIEITTTFFDAQLSLETIKGNVNVRWPALRRYRETKNLFLIYPQSRLFYMVPKRVLAGEEVASVRELLAQKIPAKSRKRT